MPKKVHRGRFQTQGDGIEESETWSQDEPITKGDALNLLNKLKRKLKPADVEKRKKAFKKAERLIKDAEDGIDAVRKRSFYDDRKRRDIRVDVEVRWKSFCNDNYYYNFTGMENSLTHPKYLFATFLEDKKVFNLAEAYWRRMITAIAQEANAPFQAYINHHDSKGRKEYDANPIFDALFPSLHKAVRIIQDEPEAGAPNLAAWMDSIELQEGQAPVPELVIALALSRESAAAARELIRHWVVEGLSEERMREVIR